MVIIGVVRDEVKCIMMLANKLRTEMFDIKNDVRVLEKRIEMRLMMINNDQNEEVLLKEDVFKRNCEVYSNTRRFQSCLYYDILSVNLLFY